jgi:hypothetical protein
VFPRLLSLAVVLFSAASVSADTFAVTNTNDSGPGSLRQAITDANAHPNPANGDDVRFNIPGSGVHTITVTSALPDITEGVVVDGWSQPGFQGAPLIELTPGQGLTADGLRIVGGATVIRGFVIGGFDSAIYLAKGGNTIHGCYLGTNATATQTVPNRTGINGSFVSDNQIGGNTALSRNIISGNQVYGIFFNDNYDNIQSQGNVIQGNYIGTNITGTQALPNGSPSGGGGIYLLSNYSRIGGSEPGEGNLVSGNIGIGVSATGFGIVVAGNRIGTVADGTSALGNTGTGLYLSSLGGTIGGTTAGARNLVSGNGTVALGAPGIDLESAQGTVQGNFVGTDITGKMALPNFGPGISIGGNRNLVGGSAPGAGNLVSGNTGTGVALHAANSRFGPVPATENIVQGNFIGVDVTGMAALPNSGDGISVDGGGAIGNRIGGPIPSARNVISGNLGNGIRASKAPSTVIQRNLIGTGSDETKPLANGLNGILMTDSSGTIGAVSGPNLETANTIAFNLADGIAFTGNTQPVRISGNSIHDNGQLGIDLGNDGPTANDAGDADSGVNGLQNFPVLSAAFGFNGNLTTYGSLNSTASKTFTLEFFANQTADGSGFGEGQIFLGQANVTTDSSGDAAFNVTFALPANVTAVSATAIDSAGSTSEFSADATIAPTAPSPPPTGATPVSPPTHADHLLNIATRLRVEPGDHNVIAGFIVTGSEPKKVIVRGLGPSLAQFNVPGVLADPNLTLTRSDVPFNDPRAFVGFNDNWKSDQRTEIESTGVPPSNDLESALVRTLEPGFYTAVLRGNGSGAGVGLIEVYDLSANSNSLLANISTRGFVGTGDNVMIAGFIVGGNGKGGTTVVVRGIGPSLSSFDIPDAMSDPAFDVYNANGTVLADCNDWSTTSGADLVRAAGLAPDNFREAAVYLSLAPGNYTAVLRGVNPSMVGVAVVEVYDVGH